MAPGLSAIPLLALVLILVANSAIFTLCNSPRPQQPWQKIEFAEVLQFSAPGNLSRSDEKGIDSNVGSWTSDRISVQIDYGLFADPLTSYDDQSNYRIDEEEIDGQPARIVSFNLKDGSHFVAANFLDLTKWRPDDPRKLTFVVEASREIDIDTAMRIIRSISFRSGLTALSARLIAASPRSIHAQSRAEMACSARARRPRPCTWFLGR